MVLITSESSSNMSDSSDSNQGMENVLLCQDEFLSDNPEGERVEEDAEGSRTQSAAGEDGYAVNTLDDISCIDFKDMTNEEIMKYHFLDLGVAYIFYNWYANFHGFAARKSRVVRSKTTREVTQQTFVCYREGVIVDKKFPSTPLKRIRRNRYRCGCNAMCRVHIGNNGRWFTKLFCNVHNHQLLDENFMGMLPAHRKMTNLDIWRMKHMRQAGIKTNHIFGVFANEVGGFQRVGFRSKDMYNEQHRQRLTSETDAKVACQYLESMHSSDDTMFWRHRVDDKGRLTHLFWSDGAARRDFSIFGDVLAFDATYKRNKYMCPLVIFSGVNHHNKTIVFCAAIVCDETEPTYVWLLQTLLEAMGGKTPTSVITDGDVSMKNAIRRVFPDSHHRLCAWHLLRNANSHVPCNPQFLKKFRQCMLGDFDVSEFKHRWEKMIVDFGLENNKWIREMYDKRHMWATAHIRGNFFAGFRTTSRCEGLNAQFGRYVNYQNNLLEFLQQYFRCLNYLRFRELEADFGSVHGEPVMDTPFPYIERVAFMVYTRDVFNFFRPVLHRACTCKVVECRQTPTCYFYTVTKYPKNQLEWQVSFCPSSLIFKCSCERFESLGIACEHIIAVLVYLNIVTLPECLVLKRWTKSAKDSINISSPKKDLSSDPTKISQFTNLIERCKRMSVAAVNCGKQALVRTSIDLIDAQIKALEDECAKDNPAYVYNGTIPEETILNPKRVRTKGCGATASASQTHGQGNVRRPKRCGVCKKTGHYRNSCPVLSRHENGGATDVNCNVAADDFGDIGMVEMEVN